MRRNRPGGGCGVCPEPAHLEVWNIERGRDVEGLFFRGKRYGKGVAVFAGMIFYDDDLDRRGGNNFS